MPDSPAFPACAQRFASLTRATACVLAVFLLPTALTADDSDFFTNRLAPNVLLLMDSSGSMNGMMYHKAWPGGGSATCDVIPSSHSGTSDILDDASRPVRANCGGSGCRLEVRSGSYYSDFVATSGLLGSSKSGYIERTFCGQTRRLYHDGNAEDRGGDSDFSRWFDPYIDWYFGLDPTDSVTTYGPDNQTAAQILAEIADDTNGQNYIDGTTYPLYKRARMTAAAEVAEEVMYRINSDCPPYAGDCGVHANNVRFGLAQFAPSSHGAYVRTDISDYAGGSGNKGALESTLDNIDPSGSTPLGESLFKLYTYFMSRTASERPFGDDGLTRFPEYDYSMVNGAGNAPAAEIPADPVDLECRKNFIVVLTDGEPGSDNFATSGSNTDGFGSFGALIGDYAPDAVGDPDIGTDATPETGPPWIDGAGAGYLDDVALFMQQNDLRPVEYPSSTQKVDVYTIGLGTTGAAVNSLLQKTANNGNGIYRQGNQSGQLVTALIDSLSDIISKSQSFTAATVPASRTTDGENFYATFFRPSQDSPFWEGHLKNFEITPSGDILDASGNCAVGATATTPPCPTNAPLRTGATGFWDAADAIPDPGSRTLYLGRGGTTIFSNPPAWSSVTASDLGLVAGDLSTSPYDQASDLNDLADKIEKSISGCIFGTDCTTRTTDLGDKRILGDIFHSNPLVLGSPNARIGEPSYSSYSQAKRTRTRVIYAGSNGGFLHAFNAGDWATVDPSDGVTPLVPPRHDRGTGVELFGFMPSAIRSSIKNLIVDPPPRDYYAVDGTPVAADVWLYRDFASPGDPVDPLLGPAWKTADQWRTVLIGGLRQGGRSYYALDVTEPGAASYPGYLWEFPCDDCANAVNSGVQSWAGYMGETWSEPVITRVRVKADGGTDPNGYERWVAIFGAGYDPAGDPNIVSYEHLMDGSADVAGRAIFMVDITTGKLLAAKHFSPTATSVTGTQIGFPEMRYAVASAPAVFDLDFDGFADVVFIGDLGGNVWKWVVSSVGDDPVNNIVGDDNLAQPNWPFRLFFRGAASTEPPTFPAAGIHFQSFFFPPTAVLKSGKLVLAFGAGERADPIGDAALYGDGSDANNNHFYVLKDADPYEQSSPAPDPVLDFKNESTLADNSTLDSVACSTLKASYDGYYLTGRDAEKFVTNSVVFLGEVFTLSFMPPNPATVTACTASGQSFLYRFDLECGTGSYPTNPGSGNEDRRKAIGSGMPTRPRISVGGLNNGGGGGGCETKVVVITSDGSVENDCPGPLPGSGLNIRNWRQNN